MNAQPPLSKASPGASARRELAFQNPCRYPEAAAGRLRPWLGELLATLDPAGGSLVVRFVSDREMRRLNGWYRGQDKPTDVLSFPGEESRDGFHLGDLVIAVPTARRQAEARGHSVERELRTLLLHGVLHCLGYDHETDDGEMAALESRLRRRWVPR